MRVVAGIVLAGVVCAGVVAAVVSSGRPGEAAVRRFFARHLDADGRVVRESGDTVSEGQAYAMLMAVAVEDRERFDSAWRWAESNLVQPEGHMAWHWSDGAVTDVQPAPDADVDAAVALVLASRLFGDDAYLDDARRLASAVVDRATVPMDGDLLLAAGPWATGEPVTFNPSYLDPASFEVLAGATGDRRWLELASGAREVIDRMTSDSTLPPDWAWMTSEGALRPIGSPSEPATTPTWGFEAFRLPVRLASSCRREDRSAAARMWEVLSRPGLDQVGPRELDGEPLTEWSHPVALVGAAAAAGAAGETEARDRLLERAESLERSRNDYYSTAWVGLGRMLLTTDALRSCA